MRLVWLLLLTAMLSGCASDAGPQEEEEQKAPTEDPRGLPGDKPADPGNVTELPKEGEGRERTFSCTVDLGAPNTSFSINEDVKIGACNIWQADQVTVVVSVAPGPGCVINGGPDMDYAKGFTFSAKCDEVAQDLENSITVRTWE